MSEPNFKIGDKVMLKNGEIGVIADSFCHPNSQKPYYAIVTDSPNTVYTHEDSLKFCTCTAEETSFVDFVCGKLDELKELFRRKNAQYAVGDDPLSNFRAGARLRAGTDSWAEMYEEAKNYRRKHVVHVERNGIDGDKVDESLADIIIYSAIMLYMHAHRQEDLKQ